MNATLIEMCLFNGAPLYFFFEQALICFPCTLLCVNGYIPLSEVVVLHNGVGHTNYITSYLGNITVQERYGQHS